MTRDDKNFVARTERKFYKSIWVVYMLGSIYGAMGEGDVTLTAVSEPTPDEMRST